MGYTSMNLLTPAVRHSRSTRPRPNAISDQSKAKAWVDQVRAMMKGWDQAMVRIRMRPESANVVDFQTRFPSALGI